VTERWKELWKKGQKCLKLLKGNRARPVFVRTPFRERTRSDPRSTKGSVPSYVAGCKAADSALDARYPSTWDRSLGVQEVRDKGVRSDPASLRRVSRSRGTSSVQGRKDTPSGRDDPLSPGTVDRTSTCSVRILRLLGRGGTFPESWRRRRNGYARPVLKHGPRSLTCMRVPGRLRPRGGTKGRGGNPPRGDAPPAGASSEALERQHSWWDPKDGDLFVCMAKPGETLVEACSDTDVQIVRPTCE